MGKVIISFKIFPSEATVELNKLQTKIEKALPEYASIYKFTQEPIAYGLNALIAHLVIPEEQPGALDGLEKTLEKISEIGQIQTLMVRKTGTL